MNKAFIFDMDGVLIDTEHAWEGLKHQMLTRLLGPDVAANIGDLIGTSIPYLYQKAHALGSLVSQDEIAKAYRETAVDVYATSKITDNLDALVEMLLREGFRIGLVTQSPQTAIDHVLPRISFRDRLEVIISLYERDDLEMKPAPDGYLEAFRVLGADPQRSFVLEDSNPGIASAKAAGAYAIGFRGNMLASYIQKGADAYANTIDDVIKLVDEFTRQ